MPIKSFKRPLLRHGAIMFLLGLLTGLPGEAFANPRLGLSAHLAGITSGLFVIALGAIWSELRLSQRQGVWTYWLALSNYLGWAALVLAAIWGTGRSTPLAAAGQTAAPLPEAIVFVSLSVFSVAVLACTALVIYGLRGDDSGA
jgi:hydroxylaminobenzene mutase